MLALKVSKQRVCIGKSLERALPAETRNSPSFFYQTLRPMVYAALGRSILCAALIFAVLMKAAAKSGSNCVPIPD